MYIIGLRLSPVHNRHGIKKGIYFDKQVQKHGPGKAQSNTVAHSLMQPQVFRFLRADRNLVLPPDYIEGFKKAEQTFLHQRVFDHINKKLVPLTPFPEHVDENAMDFLGP